jgi:pimeloyl-ACP methyl ester carboxylesterase
VTALGPPPYADQGSSILEQQLAGRYLTTENDDAFGRDLFFAPGYSLRETFLVFAGATQHRSILVKDGENYSALARGTQFSLPLFFFQGTDDPAAPTQLVGEYLTQITAPHKELVLFQGGGHNAFYFFSDRFLRELVTKVRPLAAASRPAEGG